MKTISDLRLEIKHAKYHMNFYKIYRLGSYKASESYHSWKNRYEELKSHYSFYKLITLKARQL